MTIECYKSNCKKHSCNSGDPHDEGPFCYETVCAFEPLPPEHKCKYCGVPSHVDPSDQVPPPDYCHESDHGSAE